MLFQNSKEGLLVKVLSLMTVTAINHIIMYSSPYFHSKPGRGQKTSEKCEHVHCLMCELCQGLKCNQSPTLLSSFVIGLFIGLVHL